MTAWVLEPLCLLTAPGKHTVLHTVNKADSLAAQYCQASKRCPLLTSCVTMQCQLLGGRRPSSCREPYISCRNQTASVPLLLQTVCAPLLQMPCSTTSQAEAAAPAAVGLVTLQLTVLQMLLPSVMLQEMH